MKAMDVFYKGMDSIVGGTYRLQKGCSDWYQNKVDEGQKGIEKADKKRANPGYEVRVPEDGRYTGTRGDYVVNPRDEVILSTESQR